MRFFSSSPGRTLLLLCLCLWLPWAGRAAVSDISQPIQGLRGNNDSAPVISSPPSTPRPRETRSATVPALRPARQERPAQSAKPTSAPTFRTSPSGKTDAAQTPPANAPTDVSTAPGQTSDDAAVPAQSASTSEDSSPVSVDSASEVDSTPEPDSAPSAAPAKAAPSYERLFGTIEFKGTFKGLKEWLSVLERAKANSIYRADFKLNAKMTWGELKAKLEKLSPLEQVRAVNTFWNQWPYRTDREVYGKEDYWAIPDEFRKNSGDCEDYCIAKYFTLRELGFRKDQMRVVVVKETIRNIAHAVLAVYLDGKTYILDNLSQNVLEHTRIRNYQPQFSVNEEFRWAHVRPK